MSIVIERWLAYQNTKLTPLRIGEFGKVAEWREVLQRKTQKWSRWQMTNDKNKPLTRMCLAREIKKRKPSESHVKCFKLLRQLTPAIKPICDLDGNYKFSSTFRSHSNSEIVFLLLSNGGISVVHAGKRKQLDEINSFISSRLGIGGRTRLRCKNVKKNYQNYTARNEVSGTALKSFT